MVKFKVVTEEHHRRPRSLGGLATPINISYVKTTPHRHYHTLFGNKNAIQISEWINTECPFKPEGVRIHCVFINGTRVTKTGKNNSLKPQKISTAWRSLSKGMDFKQLIEYINNVWLDPSYHFYIVNI